MRFVDQERSARLVAWQLRLGIVADSRKAAIEAWLTSQWHDLDGSRRTDPCSSSWPR